MQPLDADDDILLGNFHTDLQVGEILRRARLEKNITIDDLAYILKISPQHITAIEQGRLEVLPARIYAIGFIRAYADYVGLDSNKIIGLLKRQAGDYVLPKDITPSAPPMVQDYSLPTAKMFAVIALLLIITLILKSFYYRDDYLLSDHIPAVPADLKQQTTLLSKPSTKVNDTSVTIDMSVLDDLPKTDQIVLKAVQNVWVDIRDAQGKTIFSRVLQKGEEYWIPSDQTNLSMTMGNAGGLDIILNGQSIPTLGRVGQVIRNFPLNAQKLKENLKNTAEKSM